MPTTFFGWVWFLLQKYGVLFLRGTGITMLVAVSGTLLGFLLGLLVAIARTVEPAQGAGKGRRAAIKVLHGIMNVYIQVFRGTPMIVQAMIIYYGAMQYLGITMNEIAAAVLIVSVNTGAYMAEIIRGGILSIDKGQTEATHSIGLTHWQTMTGVVLPQAVRNILPALGNEFVTIIKESSIVSVIGIADLMYRAKGVIAKTYNSLECLAIAAIIYFILTFIGGRLIALMERKMSHGRK